MFSSCRRPNRRGGVVGARFGAAVAGLVAAAFLIAGCEVTPETVAPASVSKIKSIGVISAIGNQLNYEQIGIMVFSNDLFHKPVREYGIDRYATDLIAKQLAGRYNVQPVQYDPADFQPGKISISAGSDLFGSGQPIGEVIRAKATPNNLDAYIVVASATSGVKNSNQFASGLGMTRRAMMFYHLYWAHALYGIAVVDGHTGKVLAWDSAPGGQQKLGFLEVPAVGGPYKDVDETYWPDDHEHISPAQAKKLVDMMKSLIAASMRKTLQQAGLVAQ